MAKRKAAKKKAIKTDAAEFAVKADGMKNVYTGLNTSADRRLASTPFGRHVNDQELTDLYRYNAYAGRAVNIPADDMTRNWLDVMGDDDKNEDVEQRLEELDAQAKVNKAIKMARLYGAGILLIGVNDGGDLEMPVNEERIASIDYLTEFDRRDSYVTTQDIQRDPQMPGFGEPIFYNLMPVTGGQQFRVHASRLLVFNGAKLPFREYQTNGYFHESILQMAFEHIRQLCATMDSAEFIIDDYVTTVVSILNLAGMMATQNGVEYVKQRLQVFDKGKHISNTIIQDEGETFTKHSSTVSGIETLIDRFIMAVSTATGIPVTLLMGRSPAGENATGESDIRFWYDKIKADQNNQVGPVLEPLVRYLLREGGGKEPENWSIEFRPLYTNTPEEDAALYKSTSEGDAINVANNIFGEQAIAKARIKNGKYVPGMPQIDLEEMQREMEEAEQERAENAAAMQAMMKNAENDEPPGDDDNKATEEPEE